MSQQAMPNQAIPNGDPLAQLRDIHMPPPVDSWPPAPGWWVLAALAVAAVILLAYLAWRHWRANRYRREALRELDALYEQYREGLSPADWLVRYEALLKRVALTRYPREAVASLTGVAWVDFLDKSLGSQEFSMGAGQALIEGLYRPSATPDVDALHRLGRAWIRKHSDITVEPRPANPLAMKEAA
ncbi:MAG: DUF4381 domain-containing protein [Pseudomonadales bacterium]|nr:DUF4381 domain-containing protein [Pseudomonadales bacterium]